jgi:hypothetical protein
MCCFELKWNHSAKRAIHRLNYKICLITQEEQYNQLIKCTLANLPYRAFNATAQLRFITLFLTLKRAQYH